MRHSGVAGAARRAVSRRAEVSRQSGEGKWFATAKTIKQHDLAVALARRAPVDPKTLVGAARDHVKNQPAFALEVALMALYWMARGGGYELTGAEVGAARDHAVAAAAALVPGVRISERIAGNVEGDGPAAQWVRLCLGLDTVP